ncbi:FtsX-like permease family protein, partial [Eubacterium sp.]|uniref:FtsX-like permease family protein n=1 Tax=Eubacterium sp. TaxID=142586 RepID=UPI003F01A044
MKDLFLGLKIAKTRTILSALVTAIVTAGICITVSAFAPKGANQTSIIILCVSLAMIGCILLFLINRISSKKRDAEFLTMMYNGTSHKQIRKQLIKEVIAVALIFGLIGGAIGIGLSSPVSRILIPQKSENFSQM